VDVGIVLIRGGIRKKKEWNVEKNEFYRISSKGLYT
jgi:hypothetical protein